MSSDTMLASRKKRILQVEWLRRRILDLRELLVERLQGRQQLQKRFPWHRLDHQALPLFAHDRIRARQLELARNPYGLVPAVLEELDPPTGGCVELRHMLRHRPKLPICQCKGLSLFIPPPPPSPTSAHRRRRARAGGGGCRPRRCARPPSRRCGRIGSPIRAGG